MRYSLDMKLMERFSFRRRDAIRSSVAGAEAVAARTAAQTLFESGGRKLLPATLQRVLRGAVEREASRVLGGVPLLEAGASGAVARGVESTAMQTVVGQTVRAASRQVLRSVTAAAGAGAVIDGGWALVQVAGRVKTGAMTRREAARHVVREASTGAAATAAGTAAAAMVVVL